ncbi:ISL3 family transposase [Mesorhizobium sp. INR15]|uniref:ISL3 family transposase n=1 Tax=Mesorhizobium sp. INR15 TaxID=2654248 RepID=UPI00189675FA|nr:ISL3 family transposase [Mesorhizobium sp. INR15]QPC95954.1 ISL3 family transposase [Mesorhizobium sp. INR15]
MGQTLRPSTLVPRGFVVDDAASGADATLITVRPLSIASACPGCGTRSVRIHSRYPRRLADLPMAGKPVLLVVMVRRFHCDAVLCGRRIFAERFDGDVLAPWARRTARLDDIVHHLGLVLGGRPAASFAQRLMLPVSNDTLLRVVRRRGSPRFVPPTIIGIDDWAWRRNQRYGTIICDLERRKTIALLPDREPATAQAWLSDQPQISIVARDRGGGYAMAAAKALPKATQVADRWHLMENASRAFVDAVRKSMRQIRTAIGATTINLDLLTAAERIQYEGYLHREDTNAAILGLAKAGVTIKEIVRRTGYSRGLVRRVLRGQRSDVFRVRESSLELYLPWLDAQWSAGQRNGAELWRRLAVQGFRGSLRVVTEWTTRRRKAEKVDGAALSRAPSARTVARLMTIGRDNLSKSETVIVAAIEGGVPQLVDAREIIAAFQAMIRKKSLVDLEPWLEQARSGLVAPFANGVVKDRAAVSAAITSPWSNGQTEGQITKLKLVKRQMYGRGKLDLLQARVIGAA